jgi:NAD(P)-dependent dehydrogenase (short-subunit alcohol dehydrogenase family)
MTTVMITGCNSGFGMAGALAFARRGYRVVGTVRARGREKALLAAAQAEGLDIQTRILDVTRPQDFGDFVQRVLSDCDGIDVLVNNAGILRPGALEDLPEATIREVMETNFYGPLLLTRTLLPHMRDRGSGCIIMISSLSGLAGLAGDVAYSASKFALEGATEALRHEVDRWGIRVALVEAGQYATDLFRDGADLPDGYPQNSPYRPLVQAKLMEIHEGRERAMDPRQVGDLLPVIAESDDSPLRWAADDVARQVLASLHCKDDAGRDDFLRAAGNSDWWSAGLDTPNPGAD